MDTKTRKLPIGIQSFEKLMRGHFLYVDKTKYVMCELQTYTGRVDCIVETERYVYIFEFKRDKSADEALAQIEEMKYALPYAADQRTMYKIGVNFDSELRMLTEWKVTTG